MPVIMLTVIRLNNEAVKDKTKQSSRLVLKINVLLNHRILLIELATANPIATLKLINPTIPTFASRYTTKSWLVTIPQPAPKKGNLSKTDHASSTVSKRCMAEPEDVLSKTSPYIIVCAIGSAQNSSPKRTPGIIMTFVSRWRGCKRFTNNKSKTVVTTSVITRPMYAVLDVDRSSKPSTIPRANRSSFHDSRGVFSSTLTNKIGVMVRRNLARMDGSCRTEAMR